MEAVSFKGRSFDRDLILQSVRWYLAYALSYRHRKNVEKKGFRIDYSTL